MLCVCCPRDMPTRTAVEVTAGICIGFVTSLSAIVAPPTIQRRKADMRMWRTLRMAVWMFCMTLQSTACVTTNIQRLGLHAQLGALMGYEMPTAAIWAWTERTQLAAAILMASKVATRAAMIYIGYTTHVLKSRTCKQRRIATRGRSSRSFVPRGLRRHITRRWGRSSVRCWCLTAGAALP